MWTTLDTLHPRIPVSDRSRNNVTQINVNYPGYPPPQDTGKLHWLTETSERTERNCRRGMESRDTTCKFNYQYGYVSSKLDSSFLPVHKEIHDDVHVKCNWIGYVNGDFMYVTKHAKTLNLVCGAWKLVAHGMLRDCVIGCRPTAKSTVVPLARRMIMTRVPKVQTAFAVIVSPYWIAIIATIWNRVPRD